MKSQKSSAAIVAIVGVLSVVGCGKKASSETTPLQAQLEAGAAAPKGGSCVQRVGTCEEYTNNALGMAEAGCKILGGSYSSASCPTADLLGRCEADDQRTFYYFGNSLAPWVSDAKRECEENPARVKKGKFVAQPNAEEVAKQKAMPPADRIIGSCAMPDQCEDVVNDPLKMEKDMCDGAKGTWSTTPCPTQDVVASCIGPTKITRYPKKMFKMTKPASIQKACESDSLIAWGHYYPAPGADPAAVASAAPKGKGGATAPAKGKKP